ncbi:MAG: glyoxalase superfamily protein [Pseudomonadota bacterium]
MKFKVAIPVFRMFDEAKAREFYIEYLGFKVDFEHRFGEDMPLYLGLNWHGFELHLSEHHGDASPGGSVRVSVDDLTAFHAALPDYKYARPGILEQSWGMREVHITDPFHNRIIFCEDM